MRDKLKDLLIKQLGETQKGVDYPADLSDDEVLYSLLGSINKNLNTIKNLLVGVTAISVIAGIILIMIMASF